MTPRPLCARSHMSLVAICWGNNQWRNRCTSILWMQGIKDVYIDGAVSRIGFLYGMRVHQKSQGSGLGGRLLEEVEELSLAKGCNRMVLTVNGDNKKARVFFEKKEYSCASRRSLYFFLLNDISSEKPPPLAGLVQFHAGNDAGAVSNHSKFHEGRDMSSAQMDRISMRKPFLGVLSASSDDGTSHAGGMMWNASYYASFSFEGRIPAFMCSKLWFFMTRGLMGITVAAWALRLAAMCENGRYISASVEALAAGIVAWGIWKLFNIISFVASRNLKGIRFFGYYSSGKVRVPHNHKTHPLRKT